MTLEEESVNVRRAWMKRNGAALLVVALGVVLGCSGQKSATTAGSDSAAAYDADVKEFMALTGADSVGLQMAGYISNSIIGSLTAQRRDATPKQVAAAKAEVDSFLAGRVPELESRFTALYK